MRYKGPKDPVTRDLRRLYEVTVYTGDPEKKRPKTRKETVIAWNAADAIRAVGGKVAKQPKALHWVTHDEPPRRIDDTAGPKDDTPIEPSVARSIDEW